MSDTPPPLVAFARSALPEFREIGLPPGKIDGLIETTSDPDGKPFSRKGLGVVLKGLAEFIAQYRDELSWDATDPLIARLEGKDGKDKLSTLLADIAMASEEELAGKAAMLREALKVGNTDLASALKLAVKNIARDKAIQLDGNDFEFHGRGPDDKGKSSRDPKGDAGTWRESIHKDDKPAISDEDVRKGAAAHDASGNVVNPDDIKKSAQSGSGDFRRGRDDMNTYEQAEAAGSGDQDFFRQRGAEKVEITAYVRLADQIYQLLGQISSQVEPKGAARVQS